MYISVYCITGYCSVNSIGSGFGRGEEVKEKKRIKRKLKKKIWLLITLKLFFFWQALWFLHGVPIYLLSYRCIGWSKEYLAINQCFYLIHSYKRAFCMFSFLGCNLFSCFFLPHESRALKARYSCSNRDDLPFFFFFFNLTLY